MNRRDAGTEAAASRSIGIAWCSATARAVRIAAATLPGDAARRESRLAGLTSLSRPRRSGSAAGARRLNLRQIDKRPLVVMAPSVIEAN